MNHETVEVFTGKLVESASSVLEMFQSGNHPTESQLKRLEAALVPFVAEKLGCNHKVVEACDCLNKGLVPVVPVALLLCRHCSRPIEFRAGEWRHVMYHGAYCTKPAEPAGVVR
jgi:hypothetical protein